MASIQVQPATTQRDLRAFVKFPWRVYKDDPNWVPPLIADQLKTLDPFQGPFFRNADVALFIAWRGIEAIGTIAAFVERGQATDGGSREGRFGFFEALNEYAVAERLLDTACDWLKAREVSSVRGPMNFTINESPGVLIEGTDCPPVMLAGHTPLYYKDLLERYGMQKDHDLYAYRAFRSQIGEGLSNLPPEIRRVADVARRVTQANVRKLRLKDWDNEIATACRLFNETLKHLDDHVEMKEEEFVRLANQFRPFVDPDLALVAEVDGQPVGFCVALPDVNRVLIRLKGRVSPVNLVMLRRYIRHIKVVTFKMMGILDDYRRRGIDALLYLEMVKAFYDKGYEWLDGSLTSENNTIVNHIALRFGAQRYKQYRLYRMSLDGTP